LTTKRSSQSGRHYIIFSTSHREVLKWQTPSHYQWREYGFECRAPLRT